MQIFDVRIIEGLPFEDYLKLPGISYSFVSGGGAFKSATPKMEFGSRVDAYLFEPEKYDGVDYKLVRAVAEKVKARLGVLIKHGKRQLAVMCTMAHRGMYIYYKGRVDLFAGGMVIDLKVSELEILRAIQVFGYQNQLNGYAIPLKARGSILFSIHPKKHDVQTCPINNSTSFWEQIVLKHGTPI